MDSFCWTLRLKSSFLTVLLWMLVFCEEAELQPVWTSSPSNPSSVKEGENLNLTWSYDTNGTLTYARFWRIGDDQSETLVALKSSSSSTITVKSAFQDRFIFNISNNQALVEILPVQRSDSGTYRLQISNQDLVEITNDVEITVLFQPDVKTQQCPSPVTEGDNVKLHCNATGSPVPSTAWNRASTRKTLSYSEMLIIGSITRNESGRYECLAWNGIGNNSTATCIVDVNYPAEITFISINQTVQMGKNASLYCRADGNPTPSISWTHDHNVGSGSVLHFDSTRLNDNGWYKCTAQNGIGSPATVRVYLDVAERASNLINGKMTIINEKFDESLMDKETERYQNLSKRVVGVVEDLFIPDNNYQNVSVVRFESGSVVVIFNLRFKRTVRIDKIISVLKQAALNRKLGNFIVDPSSITAPQEDTPTLSSPISPATSAPADTSSGSLWIIIGATLGSVVLICSAGVCFCCYKRKKNRRQQERPYSSGTEADIGRQQERPYSSGTEADIGPRSCANEMSLEVIGNDRSLRTMDPWKETTHAKDIKSMHKTFKTYPDGTKEEKYDLYFK